MPASERTHLCAQLCAAFFLLACTVPASASNQAGWTQGEPSRDDGAAPARERSLDEELWATVNLCDPRERPGAVGVRVSMPPRGEGRAQWIRIRIEYWDGWRRVWRLVRSGGDSGWDRVGGGEETVLTGYTFGFRQPSAGRRIVMRGRVDFEWREGIEVTARERRRTEGGHADPDDELLRVSRRSCQIKR